MEIRITVVNGGRHFMLIPGLVPPEFDFPSYWCWGPNRPLAPTALLQYTTYKSAFPWGGSEKRSGAMPHQRYTLRSPLRLSKFFDLSVPGGYEAQLAGMRMVSNVIKFRVLPPKVRPDGPAITRYHTTAPGFAAAWGAARDGVQIAAYVRSNPGLADPTARVRILFRCTGKHAATVSMTGNPHIDFARRKVIGPFRTIVKAIDGKPAPLTAYGKLLAGRHWTHPPATKAYTLRPGIVYTYWRPLVLNREFDLSVYGPYKFSTRLHGTDLKTAPIIIYVDVQSRFYRNSGLPR
ncbi:MAG: hypothetical protein ACP5O1_11935 [Phycisphaerae bacterium]